MAFVDSQTAETWFAFTLDVWNLDDLEARKAPAAVTGEDLPDEDIRRLEPKKVVVARHVVDLTAFLTTNRNGKAGESRLR